MKIDPAGSQIIFFLPTFAANFKMEVKNLCEEGPRQELLSRLDRLTPASQALWGKMNVAQMLAHLRMPMAVALGEHQLKSNFLLRLVAGTMKSKLYDDKPYKRGLPTAPSFRIVGERDFEAEKARVVELVGRFRPENIKNTVHPVFGKMTLEQWGKANWKHIDHHLQQFGA